MKTFQHLSLFASCAVLTFFASSAQAMLTDADQQYAAVSSTENIPGAPVYNYDAYDISSDPDAKNITANFSKQDDAALEIGQSTSSPIPMTDFSFDYYGDTFQNVKVSTNGYLVFGESSAHYYNSEELPSIEEPNGVVAGLWTDLDLGEGGEVYVKYDSVQQRTIIQYDAVATISQPYHTYSFLYVLDGTTGEIEVHYKDINVYGGESQSVGLEDMEGVHGISIAYRIGDEANVVIKSLEKTALVFSPDFDRDGVFAFQDCDDRDSAITLGEEYGPDVDGDGYYGAETMNACFQPDGYTLVYGKNVDPDDTDANNPVLFTAQASGIASITPSENGQGQYDITYVNNVIETRTAFPKYTGSKKVKVKHLKKRNVYVVTHPQFRSMIALSGTTAEKIDSVKLSKKSFAKGRVHSVSFAQNGKKKRAFAVQMRNKNTSRIVLVLQKKKSSGEVFGKKTSQKWKGKDRLIQVKKAVKLKKRAGLRGRVASIKTKNGTQEYQLLLSQWKLENLNLQ